MAVRFGLHGFTAGLLLSAAMLFLSYSWKHIHKADCLRYEMLSLVHKIEDGAIVQGTSDNSDAIDPHRLRSLVLAYDDLFEHCVVKRSEIEIVQSDPEPNQNSSVFTVAIRYLTPVLFSYSLRSDISISGYRGGSPTSGNQQTTPLKQGQISSQVVHAKADTHCNWDWDCQPCESCFEVEKEVPESKLNIEEKDILARKRCAVTPSRAAEANYETECGTCLPDPLKEFNACLQWLDLTGNFRPIDRQFTEAPRTCGFCASGQCVPFEMINLTPDKRSELRMLLQIRLSKAAIECDQGESCNEQIWIDQNRVQRGETTPAIKMQVCTAQ